MFLILSIAVQAWSRIVLLDKQVQVVLYATKWIKAKALKDRMLREYTLSCFDL